MDKNTLSNYGWIVICTLVLAVMLALATPFGEFIAGAFKATYAGFGNVTDNALAVIGIGNGGSGENGGEQGGNGGSETPANGKLNAPSISFDDDNNIVFTNADANTEGYRLYFYDDLAATINAGETYQVDWSVAKPYKVIAFADGYEDADPVTGVIGPGLGCAKQHYNIVAELNGTILTLTSVNTEEEAWSVSADCDVYVDGVEINEYVEASTSGTTVDLSTYLTGDAHTITIKENCEVHRLLWYYDGGMPSTTINYENTAPAVTKVEPFTVGYEAGQFYVVGADNATSFEITATLMGQSVKKTMTERSVNFYNTFGVRPANQYQTTVTYTIVGKADGLENSDPVEFTITLAEVEADMATYPDAY